MENKIYEIIKINEKKEQIRYLEFLIQERDKREKELDNLKEKLINYLFRGGNLQTSKERIFIISEMENRDKKIKCLNSVLNGILKKQNAD